MSLVGKFWEKNRGYLYVTFFNMKPYKYVLYSL